MNTKTKVLVEIALAVALSTLLFFVQLWRMPQGGTVSLEMLPIIFIALRRGVGPGMIAGFVFGLLQLTFNPYILHPVQVIMDYPLPYMFLGLAGVFRNRIKPEVNQGRSYLWLLLAVLLGGFLRLMTHVISGVVFFAEYAPAGQNVWLYSTIYNGSYLIPSLIITYIVLIPLSRKLLSYLKNGA